MGKFNLFFLALFFFSLPIDAQVSDSLNQYPNFRIIEALVSSKKTKAELQIYTDELLKRAYLTKNNDSIAKALYYVIKYNKNKKVKRERANELISLSKDVATGFYSGIAYYSIGTKHYYNHSYLKALSYMIKADSVLAGDKTIKEYYWVQSAMAVIKSLTGDRIGSKKIHKELYQYHEKKKNWVSYTTSITNYTNLLLKEKKYDSVSLLINTAFEKIPKKNVYTLSLEQNLAIIEYHKKNYNNAISSMNDLLPKFDSIDNSFRKSNCHFFLGKSYFEINDTIKGLSHFKLSASSFNENTLSYGPVRFSLQELQLYYNRTNQLDKELSILKNIIRIDSVNSKDIASLNDNLYHKYELPKNIARKNEIIELSDKKSNKRLYIIYIGLATVFVLCCFVLAFIQRIRKKQKLYEKIISDLKTEKTKKKPTLYNTIISDRKIVLLDKLIDNIETNKSYLRPDFNKPYIRQKAANIDINSHDISDYFNGVLNQSIPEYTNSKRINEAIDRMVNDKQFVKFSMAGMAEELGYKNSTSFKRAFKNLNGLNPLEFIDTMKKNQN